MNLRIARALVVILLGILGAHSSCQLGLSAWLGGGIGAVVGLLTIAIESLLTMAPARALKAAALGLIGGLVSSYLLVKILETTLIRPSLYYPAVKILIPLVAVYLSVVIAVRAVLDGMESSSPSAGTAPKILDTSVIIDGRISDVADTGFLDGLVIIPKFVLIELQHIADSADSLKRNRGRRGLDVLNKLQKDPALNVKVSDIDFPNASEVDAKLVLLAKELKGSIVTNDFNLNKVAELQGVRVLNINDLSNAIKPVVLPGEQMRVMLLKEGKEASQGVAYLEDGTMVVVDNGRNFIGKSVDVVVTSSIQTAAGRMIFTKLLEEVSS